MEYVIFTEEEKERAGAVNLVEFLLRQGRNWNRPEVNGVGNGMTA